MSGTYTKLNFHIVFSTWRRRSTIEPAWRCDLHAFLGGALRTLNAVGLAIGGTDDHVHILAGLKPVHRLSDVVRDIKHASCQWVHEQSNLQSFHWQEGYGAFTVGYREVEIVTKYIHNQEAHHKNMDFEKEYFRILEAQRVDYNYRYVF